MRKSLLYLLLFFTLIACVDNGDFSLPDIKITAPNIMVNSDLSAIKSALKQEFLTHEKLIHTFRIGDSLYAEGYVISNDATGNFYKKLILQDDFQNPTMGIEIRVNQSSLSERFNVGRKVYILLDGLSVSYDDGTSDINPTNTTIGRYTLGVLNGGVVDAIPSTDIPKHLLRSHHVETIIPTKITMDDVKELHVNTMVALETAQFLKSDIGKTFSGGAYDEFDGFRSVLECGSEKTIPLQTSTFSSFTSNILPKGKGTIRFILSKDYRSDFLVAIVNTPADILFINDDRCDPETLDCVQSNVDRNRVVFEENFTNILNTTAILDAGWTNINIHNGSTVFSAKSFSGNRYLQIGAFRTNENPLEAWLVSPLIDLDNTTDEILSFDTATGYDNGKALTVYVSSNFTGDVTTANWIRLDAILSEGPSTGYSPFINSGAIYIGCLTSTIHIGFKYEGADDGVSTTVQIDNVKITGH